MLKQVEGLKKRIARLQGQLKALQTKCTHPADLVRYQPDMYEGRRWVNFRCTRCDFRWEHEGGFQPHRENIRVRQGEAL